MNNKRQCPINAIKRSTSTHTPRDCLTVPSRLITSVVENMQWENSPANQFIGIYPRQDIECYPRRDNQYIRWPPEISTYMVYSRSINPSILYIALPQRYPSVLDVNIWMMPNTRILYNQRGLCFSCVNIIPQFTRGLLFRQSFNQSINHFHFHQPLSITITIMLFLFKPLHLGPHNLITLFNAMTINEDPKYDQSRFWMWSEQHK